MMTPNQYRATLQQLGLSQRQAARLLGISLNSSNGYANNRPIPTPVAKLLHLIVYMHEYGLVPPWPFLEKPEG
jgi:transcriptional regulator with XRE-family HTH domain